MDRFMRLLVLIVVGTGILLSASLSPWLWSGARGPSSSSAVSSPKYPKPVRENHECSRNQERHATTLERS